MLLDSFQLHHLFANFARIGHSATICVIAAARAIVRVVPTNVAHGKLHFDACVRSFVCLRAAWLREVVILAKRTTWLRNMHTIAVCAMIYGSRIVGSKRNKQRLKNKTSESGARDFEHATNMRRWTRRHHSTDALGCIIIYCISPIHSSIANESEC